jgi:DNA-binding response OmpR family regulator/HPt (histidine-containing phosphotransfer) domain-containing protein
MRILIVEDDRFTSNLLVAALTAHHYTVDIAMDGQTGLELATLWNYDLIALDINLPKLDGMSVCSQLRLQGYTASILMLTAQNSNDDIIRGLDTGADDYVIKPFDSAQLLARIRALLRRGKALTPTILTWGDLCLNPASAEVTYQQQAITLRPQEYRLLELFLNHPQQILNRDTIIDQLWTIDDCPTEHAVTNLIKDLRRRLKAAGMTEEFIETVYGLGYRLKKPPQREWAEGDKENQSQQQRIAKLEQIAERFHASLQQRMDALRDAVHLLEIGKLTAEQRRLASEEAHRLAGNLGTFGYDVGSELGRAIEHLLVGDAPLQKKQLLRLSQLLQALQQELTKPPAALERQTSTSIVGHDLAATH